MGYSFDDVICMLENAQETTDFIEESYKIVDVLREESSCIEYVKAILVFMENHTDIEFGSPGPLVRYMETFYHKGYEQALLESISRRPTLHTIWMLNRIINDVKNPERELYISTMKNIANNPDLDKEIKKMIKLYIG